MFTMITNWLLRRFHFRMLANTHLEFSTFCLAAAAAVVGIVGIETWKKIIKKEENTKARKEKRRQRKKHTNWKRTYNSECECNRWQWSLWNTFNSVVSLLLMFLRFYRNRVDAEATNFSQWIPIYFKPLLPWKYARFLCQIHSERRTNEWTLIKYAIDSMSQCLETREFLKLNIMISLQRRQWHTIGFNQKLLIYYLGIETKAPILSIIGEILFTQKTLQSQVVFCLSK